MKIIFIKIFLFAGAALAIFESLVFFMVGFERISVKNAFSFYSLLLQTPKALNIVLGTGAGFLFLGFILLRVAFRHKRPQKSILIRENGEILSIPIDTIKNFIDQILGQNPSISDFDTTIHNNGRGVYINIFSVFNEVVPICQEVNQVREILKEELGRVFALTHFKVNFQIKRVNISAEKKYFMARFRDSYQREDKKTSGDEAVSSEVDIEPRDEGLIGNENFEKREVYKKMPWEK